MLLKIYEVSKFYILVKFSTSLVASKFQQKEIKKCQVRIALKG